MARITGPVTGKSKRRMYTAFFVGIGIFLILIYRIFNIQIINGEFYKNKQLNQSQLKTKLNSGRGIIYDRNNKPLTDTSKENVLIVPNTALSKGYEVKKLIQDATGLNELDIEKIIDEQIPSSTIIFESNNINKSMKNKLEEHSIVIEEQTKRYDKDGLFAHVIGYVKESDNKGQSGIEKSMDRILKDSNQQYISVFKSGQIGEYLKGTYKTVKKSNENRHIRTTLDLEIQKRVENIVNKEENPTAVVISDVNTGELLSMTSRPTYNQGNIQDSLNKASSGENVSLLNKVTQETFPPGSVFKVAVLYAALEDRKVNKDYSYSCSGKVSVGANNEVLRCHKLEGHGNQNLEEAFANSCNTAFYDIAEKVGKDKIYEALKTLHMDNKLDIGIEEKGSSIPKEIALRNLSIGQGSLEFTPLQINQMTQIIANNGTYKPLYLMDSVIDNNKNIIKGFKTNKKEELISPYIITTIKQMMKTVSKTGTGKELKDLVGGSGVKTGTAQSKITKANIIGKKEIININHGWITGFFPEENPKYAITVLVQGTEKGSKPALPVFKEICENLNKK